MWTKRFVLDPADDWGRIPSSLLDRGTFFSGPDTSEEGLQVDEEYDLENIWETQEDPLEEGLQVVEECAEKNIWDTKIQEDSILPCLVFEEIGPNLSLEEKCNGNPSEISESVKEVKDEKFNFENKSVEVKFIDVGGCEQAKDEVPSDAEKSSSLVLIANSKKGRRYSKDFKREVSEYAKTHSVEETMQSFNISKTSVKRWASVRDKAEVTVDSKAVVTKLRISGRRPEHLDRKEEVLRYNETHTYSDTSSKFGIPVSTIQSWTAKRRQSEEISRAVIEVVLASVEEHLESGSADQKKEVIQKTEIKSEECSIDLLIADYDTIMTADYDQLPPAKRVSKYLSPKRGPRKKKRKKN